MKPVQKVRSAFKKKQGIGMTVTHWNSEKPYIVIRDRKGRMRNVDFWLKVRDFDYRWKIQIILKIKGGLEPTLVTELFVSEPCHYNDLEALFAQEENDLIQEAKDNDYRILDKGFVWKAY